MLFAGSCCVFTVTNILRIFYTLPYSSFSNAQTKKNVVLSSLFIWLDFIDHTSTINQYHRIGRLRHMWWIVDLLFGNTAEIRPRHYCRKLWLFIQLDLEIHLLSHVRIRLVELQEHIGSDRGRCLCRRGLFQYVCIVSLSRVSEDERKDCRRRRSTYRGTDQ
jgi:hypothetical protein